MSYDVFVEVDGDEEVFWRNYTYNVGPMFRHALGRSLQDFDRAPCSEAAGPLAAGVRKMRQDEAVLRPLDPSNGWGNYDGAVEFLDSIAIAVATNPSGVLRIV